MFLLLFLLLLVVVVVVVMVVRDGGWGFIWGVCEQFGLVNSLLCWFWGLCLAIIGMVSPAKFRTPLCVAVGVFSIHGSVCSSLLCYFCSFRRLCWLFNLSVRLCDVCSVLFWDKYVIPHFFVQESIWLPYRTGCYRETLHNFQWSRYHEKPRSHLIYNIKKFLVLVRFFACARCSICWSAYVMSGSSVLEELSFPRGFSGCVRTIRRFPTAGSMWLWIRIIKQLKLYIMWELSKISFWSNLVQSQYLRS